MAYFPNGTSGAMFAASNCDFCVQWKDREGYPGAGEGCPVYDAHLLYQDPNNEEMRGALDLLIQDDHAEGPKCHLFVAESAARILEQHGQTILIPFDKEPADD